MRYKQSKELDLLWLTFGSLLTALLGILFLGDPPFVFKVLIVGIGGFFFGYLPKVYGVIIHGDYW